MKGWIIIVYTQHNSLGNNALFCICNILQCFYNAGEQAAIIRINGPDSCYVKYTSLIWLITMEYTSPIWLITMELKALAFPKNIVERSNF